MPAHRNPVAVSKAKGDLVKRPGRHADRADPNVAPLGNPSSWLTGDQLVAWEAFKREIPWLAESDRTLVEIASSVRARMIAKEDVGIQALNLLRQAVSQMGGTPADRSRITHAEQKESDPAEAYFN